MPVVNGYVSVAEVRNHIDDESSVVSDVLIERAINAASRAIDDHCGFPRRRFWRDVAPTTHDYVITSWGCVYVDDIASRSGLVVSTDDGTGTFPITWSASDYRLGPANADANGPAYAWTKIESVGSRYFLSPPYGGPGLRITGLHGWSQVPDEVETACMLKVVSLLKRKDAPFGVAGFGEFGTAVRIRADDPDVVDLLKSKIRYGAGTTG
jgi:hypothetical protein